MAGWLGVSGGWSGGGGDRKWLVASSLVAVLVVAPVVSLAFIASRGSGDLWPHIFAFVLPQALKETAILLAGVGLMVVTLGTALAWLMTAYEFPGRRIFDWALLLPLATPTYIVAFAYLDLLHPIGPDPERVARAARHRGRARPLVPRSALDDGLHIAARVRALSVRVPLDAGDVPDAGGEPA